MFLQPEFKIQLLDGFNIENYQSLTYKVNHKFLTPELLDSTTIAIGASVLDIPVGLLVATILPERELVRVVSIFTGSHQRQQGIGRAMLAKLEQVVRGKGFSRTEIGYLESLPTGEKLEKLLVGAGWSKPVVAGMTFEMTPGKDAAEGEGFKADFSGLILPEGCTLVKWADLTETDHARILELIATDPRYKGIKTPRFSDFEPLNSLAMRYKGDIVGWQLTSRLRPDTIGYDGLFVRSDVRSLAGGNSLMLHAVALQQKSGIPVWHWQIEIFQKQMLKLVESIVTPYPHSIVKMLVSQKHLEFEPTPEPDRSSVPEFNNLAELLRWRSLQQPFQLAFTFLADGETHETSLTYQELDRRAHRIAALLCEKNLSGKNVLLTLPSGLDWVAAFFGCIYAGAVPVLAFTPDLTQIAQTINRLEGVVTDSGAIFGLTVEAMRESLVAHGQANPTLAGLCWLSVEEALTQPETVAKSPVFAAKGSDLAFLLYTSGSTGSPKGVMVSHTNALTNIQNFPGYTGRPLGGMVSWLSPTHTMGLFFGILHPIYHGALSVLLPAWAVMQQPVRWLQAVSKYHATATAGSNFAFDLSSRRISPAERAGLDLSSWTLALSGGEPVSSQTLRKFSETFSDCGFKPETFYPSYGMSEATNAIAGATEPVSPFVLSLDKKGLAEHKVVKAGAEEAIENIKTVTACGTALPGLEVAIVNPATLQRAEGSEVGEIWLRGPIIALGYWNQPEATAATFQARIADSEEGSFLRTGDLGFVQDEKIFITGRLKELIVVHGRKHYPQDIETTVEKSHPALVSRGVAAFGVERSGENEEKLAIVCEINPEAVGEAQAIFNEIRHQVAVGHDLETYAIALVAPGSLPRTPGQKMQRARCRELWQNNKLETLAAWQVNSESGATTELAISAKAPEKGNSLLAFLITQRLTTYFARRLGIEPEQVDINQSFAFYGLVSIEAVNLISELQSWLNRPLSPTLTWEYPNIASLANFIAGFATQPEPLPVSTGEFQPVLEPVAVVGIGCRFPGARNKTEFWELLAEGRDTVTEVPADRWDADSFYDPDTTVPGKMTTRWGGFIPDLDQFEPLFFNISPREAVHLDPRQRLIMESAWEALEDAGIAPDKLAGSQTSVYISTLGSDYGNLMFDDVSRIEAFSGAGAADSILANRLSYFLDLKGPSLSLDTACSGSLVAIHLACQSIRTGESSLALVGGVNVILKPDANIFFSKAEALAPDGRCKVFDASANGIVRSEGAGVVVLKPLSQAVADGDRVYAVIRGSAVNSDGRSKGIMAPDKQAQQAVLRRAYQQARVSPGAVQYVEAHGTGTRLGDPIEVQALGSVLSQDRPAGHIAALGSLKSNIGHTEAAAGIAGLIKVALSLHNRQIPPNLHYHNPNPLIPFGDLPLAVQTRLGPWPQPEQALIAGVSSFGFGGTNAHVVLEEAPVAKLVGNEVVKPATSYLLPLSAQNEPTLKALAVAYRDFLASSPDTLDLAAICRTAGQGRSHFNFRHTVSGATREELVAQLEAFAADTTNHSVSHANKMVWVFSGQGSHWLGMGREMLAVSPVFRATLDNCDSLLKPLTGWSLLEELSADEAASRLNETDRTQPAIFAIQVGLAAVWSSFGIVPDAIVGQSLGEVAAAYVSGALSLEEAILVVAERSRLMKTTSGKGKTALVELPIDQAQFAIASCSDVLAVAGSNSPASSVLSGDPKVLEKVLAYLQKQNVFCKLLPGVDVAFHSPQMDAIRDELEAGLASLKPKATRVPLYSTVTGQLIAGEELDAAYWGRNLRDPFLFSGVVKTLAAQGFNLWLEVSPHPVLGSSILQGVRTSPDDTSSVVLNSMRRGTAEWATLLNNLGTLYTRGYNPNWAGVSQPGAAIVSLPTYPWQRQRFWFDQIAGLGVRFDYTTRQAESSKTRSGGKKTGTHPLLDEHLELAFQPGHHVWSGELGPEVQAYLSDHQVQGLNMLPGSAYLEMFLAAARQTVGSEAFILGEADFKEALVLPQTGKTTIQLSLTPDPDHAESGLLKLASLGQNGKWRLHSSARLEKLSGQTLSEDTGLTQREISEIQRRCAGLLSRKAHYDRMVSRGLQYGPAFQAVEQIWYRSGESLAQLQLSNSLVFEATEYNLHPALLDAAFQAVSAAFPAAQDGVSDKFLPVGVGGFTFYRQPGRTVWAYVTFPAGESFQGGTVEANISLLNEEYKLVATVESLRLKRLRAAESKTTNEDASLDKWLYNLEWQPVAAPQPAMPAGFEPKSTLIFADEGEIGSILGLNLEAMGETYLTVRPGSDYRFNLMDQTFTVDPAQPDHFRRLIEDLLHYDFPTCQQVIYLWGVDTLPERFETESGILPAFQAVQDHATLGFLHLVQAVTRRSQELLPRLWLVTNGYAGIGAELSKANLAQASLWGLGGVVLNEHPELRCSRVDFSPEPAAEEIVGLLDLLGQSSFGEQWAWRAGQLYAQRLVRAGITLPTPAQVAVPGLVAPVCQPDATYLVTGGLGGLGLAVAEWLVEQGARHLLLVGRSQPSAEAQAVLHALKTQGIQVVTANADVTEPEQVADFLALCGHGLPALKGVIHAAAVIKDGILPDLNKERFDDVIAPKLRGSWNLHAQTLKEKLDFFVLFSSMTSLLGVSGQANYVAANTFMDRLAEYRQQNGLPAVSINWGPWAEVGQAAQKGRSDRMATKGIGSIMPDEGLLILGELIRQQLAQVAVIDVNWKLLSETSPLLNRTSFIQSLQETSETDQAASETAGETAAILGEILAVEGASRRGLVETYLTEKVCRVLGLQGTAIDLHQSTFELGFDSLMTVELKVWVEKDLGIVIPAESLLQGPSIYQLAGEVVTRLPASAPPVTLNPVLNN